MRFLYCYILSYLMHLIAAPFLFFHPKVRQGKRQRLGFFHERLKKSLADKKEPRIWLHGASAGDLLALRPLLDALEERAPQVKYLVTTITNSGMEVARTQFAERAEIAFFPYDLPGAISRTLNLFQPDIIVCEYTELWPNLIAKASARNIKLVLHNGRLSKMNLMRYRMLFWLTGNLLKPFSLLLMQNDDEAQRALQLGAPESGLRVTGNTKFDNVTEAVQRCEARHLFQDLFRPSGSQAPLVWVCGSIHEGEEGLLLEAYQTLRARIPRLRLAVAPRYVEHAHLVSDVCKKHKLSYRRRSKPPLPDDGVDVFILDSIGELVDLYYRADVVFVGGSFTSRGGQNILEPAACGKPVLFGPHMRNFVDSVNLLQGRGGIQVATAEQLIEALTPLLEKPASAHKLGKMAHSTVMKVSGAAEQNTALITALLPR